MLQLLLCIAVNVVNVVIISTILHKILKHNKNNVLTKQFPSFRLGQ